MDSFEFILTKEGMGDSMSERTMNNGESYGRSWTEVAAEMERQTEVSLPERMLADRLCHSETAQESIDAVLDEAATRFAHCILFRVNNNVATVWGFRGWTDRTGSTGLFAASPVSGNPLELLTVHSNYHGIAPVEQAYVPFFEQLGLDYPTEVSLVPIEVNGRIVGILYGDSGEQGRLRSTETQSLDLATRLSLGFALVLIKSKIRKIGDS
jgi:hypothetical protein